MQGSSGGLQIKAKDTSRAPFQREALMKFSCLDCVWFGSGFILYFPIHSNGRANLIGISPLVHTSVALTEPASIELHNHVRQAGRQPSAADHSPFLMKANAGNFTLV